MGLDTTHNCWHGGYIGFNRFRSELARIAGLPPLGLMEGHFEKGNLLPFSGTPRLTQEDAERALPIRWECLIPTPLRVLLDHSDCDGCIEWEKCLDLADELERLIPLMTSEESGGHIGNWRDKTQQFVDGLRNAFAAKENVEFH